MYVSSTVGSVYVLHHPPLGRLDYVSKERFRFASATGRLSPVSTGRLVAVSGSTKRPLRTGPAVRTSTVR